MFMTMSVSHWACVSGAYSVFAVSLLSFIVGKSVARGDCITENGAKLCVGRAQLVEVGQNTSLSLLLDEQEINKLVPSVQITNGWLVIGVTVDSEDITNPLPQVLITNGSGEVILFGSKAGRTVVHFHCELNETLSNHSICQFSLESLYFLQREVSFINSLPVEIVSYIVGWIYCFVWSFYYYPQMILNFKRCSVSGFSPYRVFLSFSGSVAYAVFNVGLYWIPELQEEYFRRHPGGVIPVLLNDVVFALNSFFAAGVWVLQVILFNSNKYVEKQKQTQKHECDNKETQEYKQDNILQTQKYEQHNTIDNIESQKESQKHEQDNTQTQKHKQYKYRVTGTKWYGAMGGALFISSLWLLMLSTVVVSATGYLEWLDALYIISYVKIVTITLQYAPQVWLNCRRKSTEGCSAYSPMLAVLGGVFSVLQMFLLSYNYDDWKSIFGDPTKFGIGMITASFCMFIVFQHYVLYRKSWMKEYDLPPACSCEPGCCKCSKEKPINYKKFEHKVRGSVALPDKELQLYNMI